MIMKKIFAIADKELASYFKSPIAYIFLILTVSIFNFFFYAIIIDNKEASLVDVFKVMEFMLVFLMPFITMRVFAQEKRSGTMEFLMSNPVTNTSIVVGKYLGVAIFFTLLIFITSIYFVILNFFGRPDALVALVGYVGIWLEGMMFVSIGVMASSWTKNQIVAAISSYFILFLLYFSSMFKEYFVGSIESALRFASLMEHSESFFIGNISIVNIVYFVSITIFCLLITRLSLENRF